LARRACYAAEDTALGPVNPEDEPALHELRLDDETLKKGAVLYRQHCLYCHGLNGDGNGPTGQFLNPKPRDFREGWFKFRSTVKRTGDKVDTSVLTLPSRHDLAKTIRNGVPTASMPSFLLLPDDKLDALVSYIIHLGIRGMTENALARRLSLGDAVSESDVPELVSKALGRWKVEGASPLTPQPPSQGWDALHAEGKATNWAEGRAIYLGVGGCVQCHATDGSSSEILVADNATRRNEWGDLNLPRDLLLGTYRGGSRPIDLFYRIRLGVGGSGMPAAADFWPVEPAKPGAPAPAPRPFTDEEVWKLVDYVMSMPLQRVGR
jgi:mono/diheme cytochrome c family protein